MRHTAEAEFIQIRSWELAPRCVTRRRHCRSASLSCFVFNCQDKRPGWLLCHGREPIDPLGVPIPTGGPLGILGPGGIAGVVGALVMFDPGGIAGVTGALGIGYP